jgi:hypothetical protein
MKKPNNWKLMKYDLADFFFGKQMDEAYWQGVRIGAEYASRMMSFTVVEAGDNTKLTKAQIVGYEVARKAIKDAKKKITERTGAML